MYLVRYFWFKNKLVIGPEGIQDSPLLISSENNPYKVVVPVTAEAAVCFERHRDFDGNWYQITQDKLPNEFKLALLLMGVIL